MLIDYQTISEQILANVREEVKRLQRRKQLQFNSNQNGHIQQQNQDRDSLMCESPTSPASPASCPRSPSPFNGLPTTSTLPCGSSSTKDKPLFTFKQVQSWHEFTVSF
jgi:hypothetical protein